MTVVVWDGRTMAADKAATSAGYSRTVTKIFKVPGGVVGFAGDGENALRLLEWFRAGRDTATYPVQEGDDCAYAMFAHEATGTCWSYGKLPYPQRCEDKFDAMGAGRDYALAAMHLGCDALKAVEVACALDITCGRGVDAITLKSPKKKKNLSK
jgi:ATP-dependent protease HslVU (ClpYQ) peptidase subunit